MAGRELTVNSYAKEKVIYMYCNIFMILQQQNIHFTFPLKTLKTNVTQLENKE